MKSRANQAAVTAHWQVAGQRSGKNLLSLAMAAAGVAQNYGALILGGLLAFSLSGCVNMQFIMYWRLYPDESYRTKLLVSAMWCLDLCHSVFVAIAIWDSIITPYGAFEMMDTIPWSVGPTVEFTAMITFTVQSFFAYRIYRFQNGKLTTVVPIFVLASCRLVAATLSMSEMIRLKSYAAFARPFPGWIFTLGLTLSAFVDIMITISLCYFLRKNRMMITRLTYGFEHTNFSTSSRGSVHIIDTLIVWTIQNGSITCAAAIVTLACWLTMPQNRIFLGIHFVVAKLYANSLLATLNSRQEIRNGKQHNPIVNNHLPVLFSENFGSSPGISHPQHRFSTRFNPLQLRTGNLSHGKSIRVNVEQVVDTKCDGIIELEPAGSSKDGDSSV